MNFGSGEWTLLVIGVALLIIGVALLFIAGTDREGSFAGAMAGFGVVLIVISLFSANSRSDTLAAEHSLGQQKFDVLAVNASDHWALVKGPGCVLKVRIVHIGYGWFVEVKKVVKTPAQLTCPNSK